MLALRLTWLAAVTQAMFQSITDKGIKQGSNPSQLNYGVSVTDVDGKEGYELVVAGYDGPNLVLKWDKATRQLENIAVDDPSSPYYALRDSRGQAIGVTACDVDGDGREEIYFLNTNSAYSGQATYPDKLFKWRNGKYEDIFSQDINKDVSSYSAGRSVACVDRLGTGRYGIYLANYAGGNVGAHDIIEMDVDKSNVAAGIIALKSVGEEVGVKKFTGGRGVTVGPILTNRSDIFCDNERGENFLWKNNLDGTFKDVAASANIEDRYQNGRGVALSDFNDDGKVDIVYGNWNGPHRLYLQETGEKFRDIAGNSEFSVPTPIRTVIAADFDNDGNQELFMNNIAYRGRASNSVHSVVKSRAGREPLVQQRPVGEAEEPEGKGTGGAVVDLDLDGTLELVLSHGESGRQPVTLYKVAEKKGNNFVRVAAMTKSGAPARGARVSLTTDSGWMQTRVIDAGSGYLCQMEPVAHFGLGREVPVKLEVLFPDGRWMTEDLTRNDVNKFIKVRYSKSESSVSISNNHVSKSRSNLLESSVGTNWKSMELKSPASKIQPSEITFTILALYCLAKLC